MANRFQKLIYYLSAETPFLFVLGILWLAEKSSWKSPISISWKVPAFFLVIIFILDFFFICSFNKAKRDLSVLNVTGNSFRSADRWLVAYVITYLLPLTSMAVGDIAWIVFASVLIILILVLTFSDYVTPHPLLFCMRYHFYELDVDGAASEYVVISKKRIHNVSDIKTVSRLFEFLLIRLG